MVKMFPSLYATNVWGQANVYNPPKRNAGLMTPTLMTRPSFLPKTPSLLQVIRGQWTPVCLPTKIQHHDFARRRKSSPIPLNLMHDQKNRTETSK